MPLPLIQFTYLHGLYSPFSGGALDHPDEGLNEDEPTLLFAYCGDASIWAYISSRVTDALPDTLPGDAETVEDLDPSELAELLDIPGGIVMAVDNDWNGINFYGLAPVELTNEST